MPPLQINNSVSAANNQAKRRSHRLGDTAAAAALDDIT
jgi:hypothetical protein